MARVRVRREDRRSFDVAVGLRYEYVMLSWLFNLSMNEAARDWKARIMNAGVYWDERDIRQCRVSSSLIANVSVMIADERSAYRKL